MFSKIFQSLFATLEFTPKTKLLVLKVPLYEYRGITFKNIYIKDGSLVVEMIANSRETKIEYEKINSLR